MKYYDSFLKKLTPHFESGWLFFTPYLFFYWIFWWFPFPVSVLENIFTVLHGLYFVAFLLYILCQRRNKALYFWLSLFLLLLIPGAYLEFPADPWEHFRRIVKWDTLTYVRQSYVSTKFAYFWQWTFLRFLELPQRRVGLTFLSSFWQTLLCFQVYRLARAFKFEKKWAYLQVFAFFSLFGTNLFGIRYYALSSTPLSMVGFFALIQILILSEPFHPKWKRWVLSALGFIVMVSNHPQTVIHLALLLAAYGLYRFYLNGFFKQYAAFAFLAWVGSLLAGFYIRRYYPSFYGVFDLNEISRFGTLKPWLAHSRYMETFGVHGLLAILCALMSFRKMPLLAFFVLFPVGILVFPPVILILGTFVTVETPYRVLYAFPFSFALVEGLRIHISRSVYLQKGAFVLVSMIVLGLSLPSNYPWRGRLRFQLARTPTGRDYREIDGLASWMKANRNYPENCRLITDDISAYVLFTHMGRDLHGFGRTNPTRIQKRVDEANALIWVTFGNHQELTPVCGVIVRTEKSLRGRIGPSWIARSSRHWPESNGDLSYVADGMESVFSPFLSVGWGLLHEQLGVLLNSVGEESLSRLLPKGYRKISINSDYYLIEPVWEEESPK